MRIASFNVNGINKRLTVLLTWLASTRPDAVCLQELKVTQTAFPADIFAEIGYHAVWAGQQSWNGVAILARTPPIPTRRTLPGDPDDQQARYIEAAVNGVVIGCLYAPNGNPCPGPKFAYKLAWNERLLAQAASLQAAGVPVILAGDFNIVPTASDIYNERSWRTNALLRYEPRAQFASLLAAGWTDALRTLYPEKPPWTFWSTLHNGFSRDAGWRIDHFLLNAPVAARLTSGGVDRRLRGEPGASDHAPVWIMLNSPPSNPRL